MTNSTSSSTENELMRRALAELRELRAKLAALEQSRREPVAVIGMACRFPGGADTPEALWRLLREGVDTIREVPGERWSLEDYYDSDPTAPGKMYSRYGAFLDGVDLFDAEFFGIAAREAEQMDPQQRLLLELGWEAMERAGLHPSQLRNSKTGVYIGAMTQEYSGLITAPEAIDVHSGTGNAPSVMAGRLAYYFGLLGPALVVDTACSSSLVTVHLALQSLRRGECDMALAGGVNLQFSPRAGIVESRAMMLAADGRCKTFDASADGIGRGEGAGLVLLKRWSDARRDGDPILAVLRGSAVNHDGRSSGLTVPSERAQERVLTQALEDAGVQPAQVGYVEAHGTGTALGDPIEIGALQAVLGRERDSAWPLLVGSLKTNFGHTEGAAGIAGFIKAVLMLQHGEIPPHLHCKNPNPHIPWDEVCIRVADRQQAWDAAEGQTRIAGVSAFGLSGTNAHALLEQAPPEALAPAVESGLPLFKLSARGPEALRELAGRYLQYLDASPEAPLAALCQSAAKRTDFSARAAFVVADKQALAQRLSQLAQGQGMAAPCGEPPKLAFLFTGQGSQYLGMGGELYQSQPLFRLALDRCSEILGYSLAERLYGDGRLVDLDRTLHTQPALFAVEYALYQLWRSFGIQPDWLLGHSLGEYVAACVAGVFSLEDGLRLVAERARLMDALPAGGGMAAAGAEAGRVGGMLADLLGPRLALAAVNGPQRCTLSGELETLRQAVARLEAEGIVCIGLAVSHAFHSPLMEPMLAEFEALLGTIKFQPPRIPLAANLHGGMAGPEIATPRYWLDHALQPVQFSAGVGSLAQAGCTVFLECGPHPVLLGLAAESLHGAELRLPSLRRGEEGAGTLCQSLTELYQAGCQLDWNVVAPLAQGRRVVLPTYPFQRRRYWLPPQPEAAGHGAARHPLLQRRLEVATLEPGEYLFESALSCTHPAYLAGHRVFGAAVLPFAAYLEMAVAAARHGLGWPSAALADAGLEQPLVLPDAGSVTVQCWLKPDHAGSALFRIYSREERADAEWRLHMSGRLLAAEALAVAEPLAMPAEALAVAEPLAMPADAVAVDVAAYYERYRQRGIDYGDDFRLLRELKQAQGIALARIHSPAASSHILHPALLDACLQTLGAAVPGDRLHLPVALERLELGLAVPSGDLLCRTQVEPIHDGYRADLLLSDERGRMVARLQGLRLRPAALEAGWQGLLYRVQWEEVSNVGWGELANPNDGRNPDVLGFADSPQPTRPSWLVIGADSSPAASLAALLRSQGERVLTGEPLSNELLNQAGPGGLQLVYCAADSGCEPDGGLDLLAVLQTLAGLDSPVPLRLTVVTLAAQALPADGDAPPGQAALWALAGVAALEHPEWRCRRLDLPVDAGEAELALALALLAGDSDETQWALRGGKSYVPRLLRAAADEAEAALKADRSYLITGGLGALGLAVAEHLARAGASCLILNGRRAAADAEALAALRRLGARVEYLAADVGSEEGIASLAGLLSRCPPLAGVAHAAGVMDNALLANLTPEQFRRVWRPKAMGAWRLHELTRGMALDFFVLFSSAAAVLGSPGQGNYAAANGFLDGLAALRRRQGLPGVSIGWGAWQGEGMAQADAELLRERGMAALSAEQGLAAFRHLLAGGEAQVAVFSMDWRRFSAAYPASPPPFYRHLVSGEVLAASQEQDDFMDRLAGSAPEQRAALLEGHLRRHIAAVLKNPGLEADLQPRQRLFELGFDSLLAVDLRNRLQRSLGVSLKSTLLFDHPTLEALSAYLTSEVLPPSLVESQAAEAVRGDGASLTELSEEELATMLAGKLAELEEDGS